jgi:hypothetical protein
MALSISGLGVAGFFYTFSSAVPPRCCSSLSSAFSTPHHHRHPVAVPAQNAGLVRGRVISAYFVGVEGAIIVGWGWGASPTARYPHV